MGSRTWLWAMGCWMAWSAAGQPPPTLQRLTACEDLQGWSSNAQLVRPGRQGEFAIAAEMPPGAVGFLTFDVGPTKVDLSQFHALTFWWKVEGEGLLSLMVKVRNAPLAGGMEAVYSVWEEGSGPPPSEWRRATLILAKPTFDDWGGRPDLASRYIAFRVQTRPRASLRLLVDDLLALPPILDWEVGSPQRREGRWQVPVTLRNLLPRPAHFLLGSGAGPLAMALLAAQSQESLWVPLPVDEKAYAQCEPLASLKVPLWVEVQGIPESRMEGTVKVIKPLEFPPHPRLLLSRQGIEELKERIRRHDWARARWEAVKASADRWLAEPLELPPRGGNWWHWYACPRHGASLRTGKAVGQWEWEHICPVDNEVLRGDPSRPDRDYDGCVIMGRHGAWAQGVRDLGLAYQVTGEARYAEKAKAILLAYAERYLTYPLHTVRGEARIGGGRVGPQTLDEATWLIPLCQGADLIWETLSQEEQGLLAQKLFQPAAREVILPHRLGVHNIQCWKNSAVGLVGFLLGDAELVEEAIHNPERGYWRQVRQGVLPDGPWWEGAWGYHFYTLSALWNLAEAARNCGLDLYGEELKRMFDAPFKFMMPNWRLPAFNDSTEVALVTETAPDRFSVTQPIYELAYARYREPTYAALLALGDRRNDFALWFGVSEWPQPQPFHWQSANYPSSGYGILARGQGREATWLCLKYGPHGGGHGHPDKLGFILYARGEGVALDPGMARYGAPIHGGWYRTTLAHNTLVVDETSQREAEGKCLAFGSRDGVDFLMAEAGPIYEGVRFVRSVALLGEDAVVFVDQIRCEQEHILDVAYHQRGLWEALPQGEAWKVPDKPGYRYLRDATVRTTDGGIVLTTQVRRDWRVAFGLAEGEPTEVITATGVGAHAEDRVPLTLFRRRARETAFAWYVALDGKPLSLRTLPAFEEGKPLPPSVAVGLEVVASPERRWHLAVNPEGRRISVRRADGSEWRTQDRFAFNDERSRGWRSERNLDRP